MSRVVIGMDPHKRSATIEVMAGDEAVLGGGRFATDAAGYAAMLARVRQWPERVWAVEGCQGIGGHLAGRLLADGEQVIDVPAKLSARMRVFATGQGRKTDATDAHSVALAATRMTGLRPVVDDQQLAVLRILAGGRRALGEDHTRMVSQLHHLLLELIPGGAKKDLSAAQAKALLAKARPRDAAGKARRRVAAELIKRTLLDGGEDRRTLAQAGMALLTQREPSSRPHTGQRRSLRGNSRGRPRIVGQAAPQRRRGPAPGVNTRTKMIKRQMYGRAGFALLRHRIHLR